MYNQDSIHISQAIGNEVRRYVYVYSHFWAST